ncbi:MAG: glycosyltransferase family 2 protein [Nitrospinae bacterium]|nr:glycosyltransferase family 2 protein [Nitrospinota bacterium]
MVKQNNGISVIIPVYNRLNFLIEAIKSVLQQTCPPREIIVIDDGSQFDLYHWMENWFPQQLRSGLIQYLWQKNQGVSAARNKGIKHAQCEWIALLDSDDLWKKQKLELQIQKTINGGDKIIHTDEKWLMKGNHLNQKKIHYKPEGNIFLDCLDFCRVSPSSLLIHKSIFDDIGYFNESLKVCEDYDMWLRISLKYQFGLIKQPLVIKQGGHKGQLSKSEWGLDRFRVQSLLNLLKNEKLPSDTKEIVLDKINQKSNYLIQGALKRNNSEVVHFYQKLLQEIKTS